LKLTTRNVLVCWYSPTPFITSNTISNFVGWCYLLYCTYKKSI